MKDIQQNIEEIKKGQKGQKRPAILSHFELQGKKTSSYLNKWKEEIL